ncbi:hypothetical protein MGN70_009959 [Eutypa lata]|nr:hypothetical protein MGN70_009959 [Eutypa lata]
MPPLHKAGIAAMFMFGIVVCVSSVMMIIEGNRYSTDPTERLWNEVGPVMWSGVEVNLSLVTACLPVMRPIVLVISRKISRMFSKMTAPSATQSTTDPNSAFCLDNVSGSEHLRRTGSMRELLNTDDPDEDVNDGPGHKPNTLVDITSAAKQRSNLKPVKSTQL